MASSAAAAAATTTATTTTTKSALLIRHLGTLDGTLSQSLHTRFNPLIPHFFFLVLECSADFRFSFPVTLSLFLTNVSRPFLISFAVGLVVDLALIGLVKSIFRRSRPHYNPNMVAAVSVDNFSFPSGHASRVCFIAAFVSIWAESVKSPGGWIPSSVWAWAVLTSFSRVLLGRHFVLDVFIGACLGVLEAIFVFRFLRF